MEDNKLSLDEIFRQYQPFKKDEQEPIKKINKMIEVIKFGAEWCGPCKAYEPTIKNAIEKYNVEGSDVSVLSLDVDENVELASKFSIRAVPTTVFILNDVVKAKKTGVLNSKQLDDIINDLKLD